MKSEVEPAINTIAPCRSETSPSRAAGIPFNHCATKGAEGFRVLNQRGADDSRRDAVDSDPPIRPFCSQSAGECYHSRLRHVVGDPFLRMWNDQRRHRGGVDDLAVPVGEHFGASSWQLRKSARRFRSWCRSHSANEVSSAAAFRLIPALLTAMSKCPNSLVVAAMDSRRSSSEVTSAATAVAAAPAAVIS